MELVKLITPEDHKTLGDIQKNFPNLTYNNKGYEGNMNTLTEEDKAMFSVVSEILKKTILGFSEFNHFIMRTKKGQDKATACIRLQYDYSASTNPTDKGRYFKGVGYLTIDELLNGFNS